MNRSFFLFLLLAVLMSGAVSAQPDRSAALDKAKAKFEKDVTKADEGMIAAIDKAIDKAMKSGNKMLQEKLNYEKPLFVSQHIVPISIPADNYLRDRTKATTALTSVFQPVVSDLTKAKKFEEANAVEDLLSDTLKAGRGFGLAIPDIDAHPELVFQIEHKGTGLVIDVDQENGRGKLVLNPKIGKTKQSQFWKLEREDKGFLLKNVKSKSYSSISGIPGPGENGPMLEQKTFDRKNETPSSFIFKLSSIRHEFLIEPVEGDAILQPIDKKVKGVTTTYITMEKKDTTPSAAHLWKLIEIK